MLEVIPIYSDQNSFKLSQALCRGIASGFRAVVNQLSYFKFLVQGPNFELNV
jgi:hypothetical protein